jgi:hypothetical protein
MHNFWCLSDFINKTKKELCEELLSFTNLETHTQGEDIHEAIKEMLTKRAIDLKSGVSITTHGAPAMTGRGRGLVARLKKDHPDIIASSINLSCVPVWEKSIVRS